MTDFFYIHALENVAAVTIGQAIEIDMQCLII
jgi:hypothetical protein